MTQRHDSSETYILFFDYFTSKNKCVSEALYAKDELRVFRK